jgi:hypothetical protein
MWKPRYARSSFDAGLIPIMGGRFRAGISGCSGAACSQGQGGRDNQEARPLLHDALAGAVDLLVASLEEAVDTAFDWLARRCGPARAGLRQLGMFQDYAGAVRIFKAEATRIADEEA